MPGAENVGVGRFAAISPGKRRPILRLEQSNTTKVGTRPVIRIALSLFSTTVVTAGLGFVFWALAAHITTTEVVGRASAVISAMQLIATFATLGFNTLLIAELPRRDSAAGKRLVVTALGIAGGLALAVAVGYAFVVGNAATTGEMFYVTPVGIGLFGVGTAMTTVAVILDGALIGVQQSGRQVSRNVVFALGKLIALPVAALVIGLSPPIVFSVWLFGELMSLLALGLRTKAPLEWVKMKPSLHGFYPLWRTAASFHWINVASQAPRLAVPVMVAAQLGAEANAGLYAVLLLVGVLWIIPSHLATAMLTLDRANPEHFGRGLNTALRLSGALSVLAAVGAPVMARPVLALFGPGYEQARYCLIALATCTFASAAKSIYIPVRIAQGALGTAARATIAGTCLELGAVELGLRLGAVTGVGIALGTAMIVEASFFWPTIHKARRWSTEPALRSEQSPANIDQPDIDEPQWHHPPVSSAVSPPLSAAGTPQLSALAQARGHLYYGAAAGTGGETAPDEAAPPLC